MSPVVIGGFAALDVAVIAQVAYAARTYPQRREPQRPRWPREDRLSRRSRGGPR